MKILFLDFDGVLNSVDNMESNYFLWKNKPEHKSKDKFGDLFDQRCVNWLTYIILKTECKLVVSSTWRIAGLNTLREMWLERQLPGELYSITGVHYTGTRGGEIEQWLTENKYVINYCIVDDANDMLDHQPLVQTNPIYGLDKQSAISIINILNKN